VDDLDRTKVACLLLLLACLSVIQSFVFLGRGNPGAVVRVLVNPAKANLYDVVNVSVRIENVVGLFGYEFRLYWDSSILECTQWNATSKEWIQNPSTPPPQWENNYFTAVNNITKLQDGRARYWISICAIPPASSVDGTFSVVTLNLKVIGVGLTTLDINDNECILGDMFAQPIPIDKIYDGSFETVNHDIAVVRVEPRSSNVIQNQTVEIEVDVKNKGNVPETFAVYLYCNNTDTAVLALIGTQQVTNLQPSVTQTLVFFWNTTGVDVGVYRIFANATILAGELNIADNNLLNGAVNIATEVFHDLCVSLSANVTVAAQGEFVLIRAFVKNLGWTAEYDIGVTLYQNGTLLENVRIPYLNPGGFNISMFILDTNDMLGSYIVKANVTILSEEDNVTNNEGNLIIRVTKPPIANFTWSPEKLVVNYEVTFDASMSIDPDGSIVNYVWDFGDATYLGYGKVVIHRYVNPGNYTVSLIVIDNDGLTYNATRKLTYPCKIEKTMRVLAAPERSFLLEDVLYIVAVVLVIVAVMTVIYKKAR
jgi:hypothetical protein